jgi:hypothetical protein
MGRKIAQRTNLFLVFNVYLSVCFFIPAYLAYSSLVPSVFLTLFLSVLHTVLSLSAS